MIENSKIDDEELALLKAEINNVIDEREEESVPEPVIHYDVMKFFRELLNLKESADVIKISKVGNLKDNELGMLPSSIRKLMSVAKYAEVEGLETVSNYLCDEAIILSSTSLSRKGSFINAAITNKKVNKTLGPVSREVNTGMFGKKQEIIIGEEGEGGL